jgi:hypothetical protein
LPDPDPHETDAYSILQILNVANWFEKNAFFFREGATVHGIPKINLKI